MGINNNGFHRLQEILQNLKTAFGQVHFADIWFAVIYPQIKDLIVGLNITI